MRTIIKNGTTKTYKDIRSMTIRGTFLPIVWKDGKPVVVNEPVLVDHIRKSDGGKTVRTDFRILVNKDGGSPIQYDASLYGDYAKELIAAGFTMGALVDADLGAVEEKQREWTDKTTGEVKHFVNYRASYVNGLSMLCESKRAIQARAERGMVASTKKSA